MNVSYIVPKGQPGAGVYFLNGGAMTFVSREVGEAINHWRQAQGASNDQWDRYCVTKSDADYASWQSLNGDRIDRLTELLRTLHDQT